MKDAVKKLLEAAHPVQFHGVQCQECNARLLESAKYHAARAALEECLLAVKEVYGISAVRVALDSGALATYRY